MPSFFAADQLFNEECALLRAIFLYPVKQVGSPVTHCILVDSFTVICWTNIFVNLGVLDLFSTFILFLLEILVAHCILVDSFTVICWTSVFVNLGALDLSNTFILFLLEILVAHCILVDSFTVICRTSVFVNLGALDLFNNFILFLLEILVANSVNPDQTPLYVASDLGLHCLSLAILWIFR